MKNIIIFILLSILLIGCENKVETAKNLWGKGKHQESINKLLKEVSKKPQNIEAQNLLNEYKIKIIEKLITKGLNKEALEILVKEEDKDLKKELLEVLYRNSVRGKFIANVSPVISGYKTYHYFLVPKEKNNSFQFINNYSYLPKYFKYVSYREEGIEKIDITDVKEFRDMIGFKDFYKKIEVLDKFELNSKRGEIVNKLQNAFGLHKKEHTKYKKTLFLIEDSPIIIKDGDYDIEKERMTIEFEIGGLYNNRWGSPATAILRTFKEQGVGMKETHRYSPLFTLELSFNFPIESAEKVFHKKGSKRIANGQLIYFVTPLDFFSKSTASAARNHYYVNNMEAKIILLKFQGIDPIYLFTNV